MEKKLGCILAKTMELDEATYRLIEKRARQIAKELFKRFEAPFRTSLIYEKFELEIKTLAEQLAEEKIRPILEEKARYEYIATRQTREIEELQSVASLAIQCQKMLFDKTLRSALYICHVRASLSNDSQNQTLFLISVLEVYNPVLSACTCMPCH